MQIFLPFVMFMRMTQLEVPNLGMLWTYIYIYILQTKILSETNLLWFVMPRHD